jgi:DNA-entry nuclease
MKSRKRRRRGARRPVLRTASWAAALLLALFGGYEFKDGLQQAGGSVLSVFTGESDVSEGDTGFVPEGYTVRTRDEIVSMVTLPTYAGNAYEYVNGGVPLFTEQEFTEQSFAYYSELDELGRCGVCMASIGQDLMPDEERGNISEVKPTGWHSVTYDGIDGGSLYNRCHLIGFQLTGENANPQNLITGTRYLNVDGMLDFENKVANYVSDTGNHVLYRVTPVFEGDNLLASGVLMEAESVEDRGESLEFCVYCFNVQPGISINYADGNSEKE